MTFNCENKRFHLLRAGVSAAKVHTHPGNSPVPFHLFFEFTKIHVYIIEPLKVLFFFFLIIHFLSLKLIMVVTIILPKEKERKKRNTHSGVWPHIHFDFALYRSREDI